MAGEGSRSLSRVTHAVPLKSVGLGTWQFLPHREETGPLWSVWSLIQCVGARRSMHHALAMQFAWSAAVATVNRAGEASARHLRCRHKICGSSSDMEFCRYLTPFLRELIDTVFPLQLMIAFGDDLLAPTPHC